MAVFGAMTATCAASVMNAPAEAALAPAGDTKTTTGTFAPIIRCTISLMELSSPPGVSSSMITAVAS